MTESIAHQGKEKAAEGPECLECRGTHWTFYEVENLDGEWEQCQELCEDCKLVLLANGSSTRSTREERGIAHGEEHFYNIVKIRAWTWWVPSASGTNGYEVNLKFSSCSCPDHPPQGEVCKHTHALKHARSLGTQCDGCRLPKQWRELIEVTEDHESLTWHEGQMLCFECAMASGVL